MTTPHSSINPVTTSPIHLRSGLVLHQPSSPFRLTTPADLPSSTMATAPTSTTSISASSTIASTVSVALAPTPPTTSIASASGTATISSTATTTPSAPYQLIVDSGIPGPGSFFGDSTQDARDWMRTFIGWASIRHYDEPTQIAVFSMLLKLSAARWFETLSSSQKATFDAIKAAFYKRFADIDEWADFQKVSQLRQGLTEPVVEYLERATHLINRVKLPEEHSIRAMTAGLKPQIQSFAIQQRVATFQQLQDAALLAEKSYKSTPSDDVLSALHKIEETVNNIALNSSTPPSGLSIDPLMAATTFNPSLGSSARQSGQSLQPRAFRPRNSYPRQPGAPGSRQPSFNPRNQSFVVPQNNNYTGESIVMCTRCAQNHHPNQCPFIGHTCYFCGLRGHLKVACRRFASSSNQA